MSLVQKIRQRIKSRFDLINNQKLKKNILESLPFWMGALISGGMAALYAKFFSWAELGTHLIFAKESWAFFLITPVCFVLAWWLISKYAPYARGSGIPQVSAAIELANPKENYKVNLLLSLRIIFIKILSSLVLVFGGGIIGREGPTIQISASIFKKINDWLPDWYPKISKKNMIVTGAAAGLAAAFNTPLGGIVFAIEELTKTHFSFFKSALLTGVIIAGLTALYFFGPYLYLGSPVLNKISAWVIVVVLLTAVVAGLAGSGAGALILFILRKTGSLKNYQKILFVLLCGFAIAFLAFFVSERTFGSGKEIMVSTLFTNQKYVEWYLPILRLFGSVISFSTGASGGVFAPSLSTGASIGSVFAGWFHLSASDTNLLILCGMTASLTGITRSPFTSSILVIEMTNSHSIIFYVMLTALLANIVSKIVSKHSFYDYLKDKYIHEINKNEMQQPVIVSLKAP